ncbi:MAG: MFS transporter [Salinibacterium sp.]|nr:MFS transporter [Salinibacterium sp.]
MADGTRGVAINATLIVIAQSTQAIAIGAIALFLPLIRADLGLTFAQAGLLAAVGTLSYALMQVPAGVLADRVSPKKLFAIGVLGANVFAMLFALSDSFPLMLVLQGIAGIFRAAMFIPGLLLMTRHFSAEKRATAMGLFVAGGFSSNIVINLLGPVLVGPLGWQGVIVLSSSVGLLVLVAFWFIGDDVPAHETDAPAPTRWVWRTSAWWLLAVIQFARLTAVAGFGLWLPAFLIEDRGLSLAAAGLIVAGSAAITAPANIGGGILSDRLGRPLLVIGVALVALTMLFSFVGEITNLPLLIVVIGLIALFIQLYFGPLFAIPRRLFGPGLAGLSSGFGNFCANLGGFSSALALGLLKDATGEFTAGFYYLAGVVLVGALASLILWRRPLLTPTS